MPFCYQDPVSSPYVSHPGQQCSTSWTNTSHSVQKSFLQSWHRYRSNGLIPSLTFAEGVSSNGRAQAWQVVLVTPSSVILRQRFSLSKKSTHCLINESTAHTTEYGLTGNRWW